MNAETIYQTTKAAIDSYCEMHKDAVQFQKLNEEIVSFMENCGFHKPLTALYRLNMEAREEMYRKNAKASYKPSLAAVKRLLKNAGTHREALTKAWWAEGLWWVCDGYRVVGLKEAVDTIPTYDPDVDKYEPVDIAQATKPLLDGTYMEEVALPEKGEIKQAIADWKAGGKQFVCPEIIVGEKLVNAQYLLDMVEILPQAKAYEVFSNPVSPIFLKDEDGNVGMLLPIKPHRL